MTWVRIRSSPHALCSICRDGGARRERSGAPGAAGESRQGQARLERATARRTNPLRKPQRRTLRPVPDRQASRGRPALRHVCSRNPRPSIRVQRPPAAAIGLDAVRARRPTHAVRRRSLPDLVIVRKLDSTEISELPLLQLDAQRREPRIARTRRLRRSAVPRHGVVGGLRNTDAASKLPVNLDGHEDAGTSSVGCAAAFGEAAPIKWRRSSPRASTSSARRSSALNLGLREASSTSNFQPPRALALSKRASARPGAAVPSEHRTHVPDDTAGIARHVA